MITVTATNRETGEQVGQGTAAVWESQEHAVTMTEEPEQHKPDCPWFGVNDDPYDEMDGVPCLCDRW